MITTWREAEAGVTYPEGFVAAGVRCGLKSQGEDLALLVSESSAACGGVFTTNRVQAACVGYSRRVARSGAARALIANSGNANACNGEEGEADNRSLAEWASRAIRAAPDTVLTASTGVIGHRMPMHLIQPGIRAAVEALDRGPEADEGFARAILTTDTRIKQRAVEADADAWVAPIRLGGACKGSGMIAPRMATMLAFFTTDVRLPADLAQSAVELAAADSFNRITVDGDTSTNDMCLLLASGMGEAEISRRGPAFDDFVAAFRRIALELALEIVRDGEGASKLVQVEVRNAVTQPAADSIGRAIAESPLVKTALFGSDPNWGRILAAAGRAGVPIDPHSASITIGDTLVCTNGHSVEFDRDAAHDYLTGSEVRIVVDLDMGDANGSFWTCDFSYDYVRINAEYHT